VTPAARLITAYGLGAPLLLLLPLPRAIDLVVGLALLGVVPGLSLVRRLGTEDPLLVALMAVLGSITVTIAVSTALIYLELWSSFAVTFVVGLVPAALELSTGREAHELA
jgi:hypothetical protein